MSRDSNLQVDYDLLSKSAEQLGQIRNEFNGLEGWKKDIRALVGDGRVQSAMSDFVDNWDKNRKRLVEEVGEVGKMVEETSNAFKDLDGKLSEVGKGKGKK